MKQKRLLTMLVLLVAVAAGAWAQSAFTAKEITSASQLTSTDDEAYVAACMPSDFLAVDADVAKAWTGAPTGSAILIYAIDGDKIKMATFLNGSNKATTGATWSIATFKDQLPNAKFFYTAAPTHSVTLAEGTEDFDKWTISPTEAAEGATVTVTYSGEKKVKSVKAVKKAAPIIDLSTLTANYEAKDGETLTGTLASNVKISIAAGATVTLKDVNITNLGNNCNWEGISCPGDATLVLEGTNTVCAGRDEYGDNYYPGIYIASGKTLTIQGDGTLTAYSNGTKPYAAGIGGAYQINCGNIVINSGTITATGGITCAGIGTGYEGSCGNITINGGTITATGGKHGPGIGSGDNGTCGNITISGGTVEATGGYHAAGIGGGNMNGPCGTITITSGVTSVKATKGEGAESIGKGYRSNYDITVNIENGAKVTLAPVTVTWNSPNFNSSPYTRDGVTLTAGNAASGNNFYDFGEKTFTNTIGKFTKIEIVCGDYNLDGWAQEKVGEYQEPEGPSYEIFKLTWTGNAESVTIPGKYVYSIQSITFTIQ